MFDHIHPKQSPAAALPWARRPRDFDSHVQAVVVAAAAAGAFFQSFCISSSDMPLLSGTNFQTNRAASTLKPPYSQYAKSWLNASLSRVLPSMMLKVTVTTQFMNHCA